MFNRPYIPLRRRVDNIGEGQSAACPKEEKTENPELRHTGNPLNEEEINQLMSGKKNAQREDKQELQLEQLSELFFSLGMGDELFTSLLF